MATWLVDTHVVLWALEDSPRISANAREVLEDAGHVLYVSVASVWEIVIKTGRGLLKVPADLPERLRADNFLTMPVRTEHAWRVRTLDGGDHQDPFDRMLAAQALVEGMPVISGDNALDRYGVVRRW